MCISPQTNYEAGLRILYIDEARYDLHEVAHFDVHPPSTTAKFRGSWSSFPYFKSGNIFQMKIVPMRFSRIAM